MRQQQAQAKRITLPFRRLEKGTWDGLQVNVYANSMNSLYKPRNIHARICMCARFRVHFGLNVTTSTFTAYVT